MNIIIETFDAGFTLYLDEFEVGTIDQLFGARYCAEAAREMIEQIADSFDIEVVEREADDDELE